MPYYTYILASKPRGTLYIGVTNDIARRAYEHRQGLGDGFTKRYGVHRLVHYEPHETARNAIQREKTLKHWVRAWKVALIEENNPAWRDLYDDLLS
jgi:putative endonuclease